MIDPVDCDPLVGSLPDQAPDAVQAVALVADQVSVEVPPLVMVLGFACSSTRGGAPVTVTTTLCVAEPFGPLQVSSYSVLLVS
jgi:hypothetical protein